jgi:hypothetical protein
MPTDNAARHVQTTTLNRVRVRTSSPKKWSCRESNPPADTRKVLTASTHLTNPWVKSEDPHRGRLSFQGVGSPVDELGYSRSQGIDSLMAEKDRVPGGFGELFDARSDICSVADQSELKMA